MNNENMETVKVYIYDGTYRSFKYLFKNIFEKDKWALQIFDIKKDGIYFVAICKLRRNSSIFYNPGSHIIIEKNDKKLLELTKGNSDA